MSDLIGATRIFAENAGSVPVFLDPPRLDGGSRARLWTELSATFPQEICTVNWSSSQSSKTAPSYVLAAVLNVTSHT